MSEIIDVDWREASRLMDNVETCGCDGCHVHIAESFRRHRNFIEEKIAEWLRLSPHFINGNSIADGIESGEYLR